MKSCLVVDDSRVVRKVARKILEELHFACSEAEDGKQAMESCAREMPNAILLEIFTDTGVGTLISNRKRP